MRKNNKSKENKVIKDLIIPTQLLRKKESKSLNISNSKISLTKDWWQRNENLIAKWAYIERKISRHYIKGNYLEENKMAKITAWWTDNILNETKCLSTVI